MIIPLYFEWTNKNIYRAKNYHSSFKWLRSNQQKTDYLAMTNLSIFKANGHITKLTESTGKTWDQIKSMETIIAVDQRRMNCIAASAPKKKTVGTPRVWRASQRTVNMG